MVVIIVGGGKVGYYLAKTLLERGNHPHIVDSSRAQCVHAANDLDIPVTCGDGTKIDVLESAGIRQAGCLVSVTGRDEDNLISCQLAKKKFGVAKTIARVNNPKNVEVMKMLGVDIPISSTNSIASLIEREVDASAIRRLISLSGEASINELVVNRHFERSGVSLSELRLPEESVIVSITRDGELIIPRGNTQIFSGDKIILIAKSHVLYEINRIFNKE